MRAKITSLIWRVAMLAAGWQLLQGGCIGDVQREMEVLFAPGAALAVLGVQGLGQVHVHHVGQRGQPGQHVCKFLLQIRLIMAVGDGGRQFPHFLHEPKERTSGPPLPILVGVHLFDQSLEVAQVHVGSTTTTPPPAAESPAARPAASTGAPPPQHIP